MFEGNRSPSGGKFSLVVLWATGMLSGLSLFSNAVLAKDSLTEEDLLADIPMVVAATRLPQPVTDTPVAITVIDRQMIDASGFLEIPDLLRLVPGFQVGLSWRDHHTAVTYHGQSDGLSRRMQVLIDGRVAVGSLFGIVDWDRLGIVVDDIARIEVVRGPSSVSFGSNAFIGAINIITRGPYDNPGWRMSAAAGSRDMGITSAQYSHVGEKFDYRASANYFHTHGFSGVNDETTVRSGRFQGHYQVSAGTALDFQLGHAEGPWGRGGTGLSIDPATHKDATEQYGNFRFTQSASPGNEWYFQVGMSSSEEDDKFNVGLLSDLFGISPAQVPLITGQQDQQITGNTFDYMTKRLDIEFQQLMTLSDELRAVWGLGYREDKTEGISTMGKTGWETMETYRVYGNLEYRLSDRVLLNVGTTYEDNDVNKGEFSPRIGVNVTLAKGHVLRFAVSESWRQPFVAEQLHDVAIRFNDGSVLEQVQLSPGKLDPERLRSYEIGYIGHWLEGTVSTDIKVFREEFEDEVEFVLDPFYPEVASIFNPGTILDVNGGSTDITGVETGIKWQLNQGTQLWLSYAFSEVDQHCQTLAFRCFHENDATPKHTGSLLVSHDFNRHWQASIGYYYLDEMAWTLWGGDTESYDRIDMRIARTFNLGSSNLKLELIGQNLGSDYKEFNQRNVFETRTFVRATVQFH
ncbi:MAG: TonB-dependent receptor [Porticoccus sp.]|nr:TonB-dependent receptor [Porticoccus sp.]